MSEHERSTVVLQALDTLSGFNSALAVQVNTTRQDVRIAKEKLREEERQNKEAQQSLEDWSREVESERQLLFEAMAYLNDDVRSPSPDIQKIQSDIKRLKDFIAYKVQHAEEEREQYLPQTSPMRQRDDTSPRRQRDDVNSYDIDDTNAYLLTINDRKDELTPRGMPSLNETEIELLIAEKSLYKGEVEELKGQLEKVEGEAASLIGRIVAEKESLSGDRDLLLQQLTNATTQDIVSKETILSLKKIVADASITAKSAVVDLIAEREEAAGREKQLGVELEQNKLQSFSLHTELDRAGEELIESLKANAGLGDHVLLLEEDLAVERSAREKERAALSAAMEAIEQFKLQIEGLKVKDIEREEALDRIAVLDRDMEALNYEKYALEEEITGVREELEVLTDKGEQDEDLIEQQQDDKNVYESGVELVTLKEKVSELSVLLISAGEKSEAVTVVSSIRLASSNREIDRLALDVQRLEETSRCAEENIQQLELELCTLKITNIEDEKQREVSRRNEMIIAQSEETKTSIAELHIALLANRELSKELKVAQTLLDTEVSNRTSRGEASMMAVSLKEKQVEEAIEASKATLHRAADEVDNMKNQLINMTIVKEDLEKLVNNYELQFIAVKNTVSTSNIDHLKLNSIKSNLEMKIEILQGQNDELKKNNADYKLVISKDDINRDNDDARVNNLILEYEGRINVLTNELERTKQLKDMAETRAAALALVSNGHKVYEAVHALSITTGDTENEEKGEELDGSFGSMEVGCFHFLCSLL
eukprot:CAMPEP_0119046778 /NCGR_PEP_ID=MMETSP1177-20130426/48919_1 /TAXON_ID=2985 /ORGANISM="Ochromonas sp, Strain CCMP1899" /LENGTH=769 /DNA_ID=CAMNT_0007020431 /DNA_START=143 /DNA_END=2449 /DNA_ORIENTATION=+